MTSNTVKCGLHIDLVAIARWRNEGGAPGPLKRGANRLRLYDALIPMRGVDLNQYGAALVQKDTEFRWLVAKTEAGKRARHRKHQLGNRVADTPASASQDDGEKVLVTQAAQDPRRENLASSVSYDLWRFSREMPDALHLCNNLTPP